MNKIINKKTIKVSLLIGMGISLFGHLLLVAVVFYILPSNRDMIIDEGDLGIKAVMLDLSQLTAPDMSSIEVEQNKQQDILKREKTELLDETHDTINKVEPETKVAIASKPVTSVKVIHDKTKSTKPIKPVAKPQVRQEVSILNRTIKTVSPTVSESSQYSRSPTPISRRQPEYPRRALDLRIEGRVVVKYDIDKQGQVVNIRIIEAIPSNIFNQSVRNAMRLWTYQAIEAKDLTVTIIFNRDKSINLNNS